MDLLESYIDRFEKKDDGLNIFFYAKVQGARKSTPQKINELEVIIKKEENHFKLVFIRDLETGKCSIFKKDKEALKEMLISNKSNRIKLLFL